jgi:uncharacterized membrane protein YeiH
MSISTAAFVLGFDLLGTFAFALNGALTAARMVRLDIVGVLVLGIVTATGGGLMRDVLLGAVPPAAFTEWYYLAVASAGALMAFFITRLHRLLHKSVLVLDAIGLSLFCVVGARKALAFGVDPVPAILLGAVTAVGGGTVRDVLIGRVPAILSSGLYAIPALVGATIAVLIPAGSMFRVPVGLLAAVVCFIIRMVGVRFNLNAPTARAHREESA